MNQRLVRRAGRRRLPLQGRSRATRTSSTAESQYGGLCRFDRRTGQRVQIQPQPAAGRTAAALELGLARCSSARTTRSGSTSPATSLFRSDDRGDSWKPISRRPDAADRPQQAPGHGQGLGAGRDLQAQLDEPLRQLRRPRRVAQEGRADLRRHRRRADSDHRGRRQDTGGRSSKFPGVPANDLRQQAGRHRSTTPDTVYACFDNHKNGDFKPYILKSTDAARRGRASPATCRRAAPCTAWPRITSIRTCCSVGTEFGLFFTLDGGKKWHRIKNGLPTIQVKDLCIQRKANDLVIGTFGRGIYVIDDYSPLRMLKPEFTAEGRDPLPGAGRACCTSRRASTAGRARRFSGRRSTRPTTRRSGPRSPTTSRKA